MGHAGGEEGRQRAIGKATQESGQTEQVGLVLPAEVARARKERRKERDL